MAERAFYLFKRYTLTIVLMYMFMLDNFSQDQGVTNNHNDPFILGYRQHYGFIIPHSQSVKEISYSHPWMCEIDFDWLLIGDKAWDYCFCYPRLGFSTTYINFDNPEIIGSGISLVPHIEPFLSYNSKINLSFRAGLGFVYLNNPYDSILNPLNYFYSTYLSYEVVVNIALNVKINNHLSLRFAGNYNHISNGGVKPPNKGINFPTANLGLDYTFHPPVLKQRPKTKKELYPENTRYNFLFIITGKNAERSESKMYPVFGLALNISQVVARVSALNIGAEWINDGALKEQLRRNNEDLDHNKVALLGGHELLIGKFTFSQQLGYYVYDPHKARNEVYQRYGLSYHISKHFFTGINLKTHLHVADFLDMRAGFTF